MKGYWIVIGTEISDQEAQGEYGRLWKPIAERYQARISPSKVPPLLKEARDAHRLIIVEFPPYEIAKACYDDPAYEEARRSHLEPQVANFLSWRENLRRAATRPMVPSVLK